MTQRNLAIPTEPARARHARRRGAVAQSMAAQREARVSGPVVVRVPLRAPWVAAPSPSEGEKLRAWRRSLKMPTGRHVTIAELAAAVGCSPATLGAVERGVQPCGPQLAVRLSQLQGGQVSVIAAIGAGLRAREARRLGRAAESRAGDMQLSLGF